MCGIVGYIGQKEAQPVLLAGLKRLEYRGYDSSGIAIILPKKNSIGIRKSPGKINALEKLVKNNPYLQVQKTNSLVSKFKISENIDLSKTLLVKQYENLKGEIKTDSKIDENSFKKLMYTARENHIAYELNNSCHEKIVAIYGSSHRKNIINLLKNEYNWNITKIIKY